jgi:hypothetical protein
LIAVPFGVQQHILFLLAHAAKFNLQRFAFCFETHGGKGWNASGVLRQVHANLKRLHISSITCKYTESIVVKMFSSAEQHTMMVFEFIAHPSLAVRTSGRKRSCAQAGLGPQAV